MEEYGMNGGTVRVWDLGVRVFHWSLLGCFVVAYLTGEEESELHAYAGYGILALILFRIVWGFVGPQQARFSDFVHPPVRVVDYLRGLSVGRPQHYLGHNPAAGWMIMLLLLSLSFAVFSGLKTYGAEGHGPLAGISLPSAISSAYANGDDDDDDDDEEHEDRYRSHDSDHEREERHEHEDEDEEFWEEVHEASVNITLLLAFVHVLGAIGASLLHNENLIKSMITGNKMSRV